MKESVRNRIMRFLCIAIFLSMLIAEIGVCVKNVSYANTASLFAASGGAVIAEDNQAWSNSVGGSAAVTYKQEVKGTQGVMIAGKDGDTAVYSETVDLWNKNAEEAVIKFLFPTTAGTEYAEPNFVVRFTSVADPNKYFSVFFLNRAQTNVYHVGVSTYYEKHMQSTSLADTTNTKQERIIYTGINYGNNSLGYVNNTGAVLGTGYGPNGEVPESIGNYRDESGTKMTDNDSPLGIYFEMFGGTNADGTARYDNTVYTNAGFTHLGYSPQVNIGTEESPLYRYTVQSLTHIYNTGMQSPALELSEEEASAMRLSITFMENAKGGTPTPTAQGRILVTEVMGKSMAASEDSFSYDMFNGVHVTSAQAGGTVTYNQAVRLNDNTALDKLVEFSIDPSTPKTSAAGAYSPDFEELTVRMESSSGKAVDIRVGKSDTKKTYTNSSFYDGELACNNMIVTAAGGEQTLLTAGDGLLPQTFAAYSLGSNGHLYYQTSDAFIDENGTMVMDGNHTRFALYYDAWENALYTDFGRKNAENMRSFVDENNKTVYRWLIRDFDEALGEDTAVFEGFGEEDVTISIEVGAVAEGRTAAYTIYAIDGRSLAVDKNGEAVQTVKPVRAQESVVSYKGQTIPVPGLTVYNCHEGWIVDREQSAMYYVIVKDPAGRKIESASDVLWSEELAVTLDVTGTYTVEYYSDLLTEPFAETAIVAEEPEVMSVNVTKTTLNIQIPETKGGHSYQYWVKRAVVTDGNESNENTYDVMWEMVYSGNQREYDLELSENGAPYIIDGYCEITVRIKDSSGLLIKDLYGKYSAQQLNLIEINAISAGGLSGRDLYAFSRKETNELIVYTNIGEDVNYSVRCEGVLLDENSTGIFNIDMSSYLPGYYTLTVTAENGATTATKDVKIYLYEDYDSSKMPVILSLSGTTVQDKESDDFGKTEFVLRVAYADGTNIDVSEADKFVHKLTTEKYKAYCTDIRQGGDGVLEIVYTADFNGHHGIYKTTASIKREGVSDSDDLIIIYYSGFARESATLSLSYSIDSMASEEEPDRLNVFTITADGAIGDENVKYAFYKEDAGGWNLIRDYSPDNQLIFMPKLAGNYKILARILADEKGNYEREEVIVLTVKYPTLSLDRDSAQIEVKDLQGNVVTQFFAGQAYTINASYLLGENVLYLFTVYDVNAKTQYLTRFSPSGSITFVPRKPDTFIIEVRIISAASYGYSDVVLKYVIDAQ